MADPFVSGGIRLLRAKGGACRAHPWRAGTPANAAGEKTARFAIAFNEVLAQLRANEFEQIAQMPDDRVVLRNTARMAGSCRSRPNTKPTNKATAHQASPFTQGIAQSDHQPQHRKTRRRSESAHAR